MKQRYKDMNFKELYGLFLAEKTLDVKPSTRNLYKSNWKYLEPKIGSFDISDFGRQQAKILVSTMIEEGLSPKTTKDRICFVKQLLIHAAFGSEIKIKPLDWKMKFPIAKPQKVKNFNEVEMLRIVKHALSEIESENFSSLPIIIAILTGMRIGEVLGLKWKDLDFVHNLINVERNVVKTYDPEAGRERMLVGTPKTAAGFREIPLLPTLKKVLKKVGGNSPDLENYIIGNSGLPRSPHIIRDTYSSFLKRHKLPKLNFHCLRHTFATLLVESGGDVKTISVILGHSNVTHTLNLYVHPSLESKRKVVNRAFNKLRKLCTSV